MRPSENLKLASILSALAMLSLFAFTLGPAGVNPVASRTDLRVTAGPAATAQPQCRLDFQIPEGLALQQSDGGSCSAAQAESPFSASASPHRHGYCRCSCGYPCQTSADCGGVSCDPFITCC